MHQEYLDVAIGIRKAIAQNQEKLPKQEKKKNMSEYRLVDWIINWVNGTHKEISPGQVDGVNKWLIIIHNKVLS